MTARSKTNGSFTVGGSDRKFPTLGMALNFAQMIAERAESDDFQVGVFLHDRKILRVQREHKAVVTQLVEGSV